jgi:hypothetical protein
MFESFSNLELEAAELLEKATSKRDADETLNNTERRVLFMIVDNVNNARTWLSLLASDEFSKEGVKK